MSGPAVTGASPGTASRRQPSRLPGLLRISGYFWPHVRKHRGLIVGSAAALLVEVALRLLEPWPLKLVFDRVIQQGAGARPWAPALVADLSPMALVSWSAVAVVAITGLRALASYWQIVGFAQVGNRVLCRVRERLYRHVQYLSLSFHSQARTGDLVVRVISDVGMLQDVAVTALLPLVARGLVVGGMIALMFAMNVKLACLAVSVLPLFWLRTVSLTRRIREVARKQRRQESAMAATATESMNAIRTVQA